MTEATLQPSWPSYQSHKHAYCLHSLISTFSGCAHGTIRLVGGTSSLEGRVELCVNGLWGTVCSDGWTAVDANVACRQLGYSGSGKNI